MSVGNELERARLLELAIERSVGGLSAAELQDLERALGSASAQIDDSFEQAAAAAHLALRPPLEPLPRDLAIRIADDADRHYAALRAPALAQRRRDIERATAVPRWFAYGGWIAAAASFVAFVGVLLLERAGRASAEPDLTLVAQPAAASEAVDDVAEPATQVERPGPPERVARGGTTERPDAAAASAAPTPAEARAALLASQPFALRRNWSSAGDPSGRGVTGDVVWDARSQTGYMRFVGLRRNDAAREQYQLWIFDGRRDQRYPVDGGVFDADGSDEIVVPIRARLPVGTPLAFAVTLERAGGVVVSERERVVVIARSS
ncbi:MAG: anti-sigma factor [Steroidobacteraceae bacterium]